MKKLTKVQKAKQKRIWKKRKRLLIVVGGCISLSSVLIFLICFIIGHLLGGNTASSMSIDVIEKPDIVEAFLTPNEYSRPQIAIDKVNGIVIHYTANPGTDAKANRNYFESLKSGKGSSVSSHFVIGLDGTIIQCIPLNEVAYASNNRNADTISIECCHKTEDGKFTEETYKALVKLVAWLCGEYNLSKETILRHYDVTGKDCPRYFVANEDKWEKLKEEVFRYIKQNKIEIGRD